MKVDLMFVQKNRWAMNNNSSLYYLRCTIYVVCLHVRIIIVPNLLGGVSVVTKCECGGQAMIKFIKC
jgi:hypothetical protein